MQQEVPRVEAGGADTREGPPRPGEFGELPSGGPRSDLILHFELETLHLGSLERTLVVVGGTNNLKMSSLLLASRAGVGKLL